MGYTHYWYRVRGLDTDKFKAAIVDIKPVLAKLGQMGVKLAGSDGSGASEVNQDIIALNGVNRCGHAQRDLGITWPAHEQESGGIGSQTKGHWFAGSLLMERTCGGDCSHESFIVERIKEPSKYDQPNESGLLFDCCKTAYKPYDLAVTAALIILKHHMGDAIKVSSDGENKDWRDAAMVCQLVLGYGANFKLPVRD